MLLACSALLACATNADPGWQLRHDRIIAVRVTPPHLLAGQVAEIDALVTSVDGGVAVQTPAAASAAAPLAGIVSQSGSGWQVTAPDEATLGAARAALGLADGAVISVQLSTTFVVGGETLVANKLVYFGDTHENPEPGAVTVDGAPPESASPVPFDTDVALRISEDAANTVSWLTSCGSFDNDNNEHAALLHVKPGESITGQLAVVVRDPLGGVGWQTWPLSSHAQTTTP
ncbi:MAG: hypothetical protein JWO36_2493 [Myxococcales bacterium]|nr:hypothetical protein [Myxococcales bacterium]